MINRIKLIALIATIFPVLSSCDSFTTIQIYKSYVGEEGGSCAISDSFSASKGQKFSFELSYNAMADIHESNPGCTLLFVSDPIGLYFVDDNYEINITYNNEAMKRYHGSIEDFYDLMDTKPMSAKNKFVVTKFYSINDDEQFSIIYMYHPYKNEKDKIKISLASGVNCNKMIACAVDGRFN